MKSAIKKALFGTTLVFSLSASTATYAVWPALLWEGAKTVVFEVASNFAWELFDESAEKEDIARLESKIKELKDQLPEKHESGDSPSKQEFDEMKQLVTDLSTALAALKENTALPPAQRIDKMEKEVAPIHQAVINKDVPPEERKTDLNIDVNYVYRSSGKGKAVTLGNGAVLQSGDTYKLQFTPKQFSYIYVFQVDSSGKIQQLFPMSEFKGMKLGNENPVLPNKTYQIPAQDKSFRLDNQTGTEKIYFLATRGQDVFFEAQYGAVLRAQKQGNGEQLEMAQLEKSIEQKGFSDIERDPDETIDVDMNGEKFSLLINRLQGACNGCVHKLTFEHK
jgi:hypothetical protein